MDYRVLGPLEVRDGDLVCEIGGPKQRTVVAVLVAASGRPVSIDALLQALYGDDAAPSLRRSLQTYVSNLRQVLGGSIEYRANAYRIALDDSVLDAAEFEAAVERAGDVLGHDPAEAAGMLRAALSMWRGPPYADVEAHGHLDGEIARLTEQRVVALERRFEAELASGRHREVVAEIANTAADHPWRERFQVLHMTALYRSGRQTEALRAFEQTRVALADGLGVDPSPELRELEHRILLHDRTLLGPTQTHTDAGGPDDRVGPSHAGVLTFLYTDIESSTKLLRELGDSYDEVLALHHRIVRGACQRHGATELANDGDGFVVAFAQADDAFAAAIDLQREIHAAPWPAPHDVLVRVGMHSGFARLGASGYSGLALHQAARVVGAAHGAQILATAETVGRLGREPADVELVALGRFRVRDFDDPVELFTVRGAGLPVRESAPRVPPAERHNIVRPTTSLVDRVDDCRQLLEDIDAGRLVTLVGPGGVGKTRLATEAALALADQLDDGVWFVAFAPVGRSDLVDAAVADVLGAAASAGVGPRERILAHLAERRTLLVLDNCEHVASAVAELADAVLSRCPRVALLATSRSPIRIRSERVHRLDPLAVDVESLGGSAVELFEDRHGNVSSAERADVAELCRELDGLPLAIELAALRARTVPPGELVRWLRRSPNPLAGVDPGLPERHRSLARLLDWSIGRLETDSRAVLQRVSVCVGGFDLDGALALCVDEELDEGEVVEHLWSLVDGSLIAIDPRAGETRYRLMTTVRRHVTAGADHAVIDESWTRLAAHLRREIGPEGDLGRQWVARVANEIDNVRAVVDRPTTDPDVALTMAWTVGMYHDVTNDYRTGIDELTRWASRISAMVPERVAVLTLLADMHLRVAELDAARAVIGRAREAADVVGAPAWDQSGLARARADLALRTGEIVEAIALLEEALASPGGARAESRLWGLLGIARRSSGDLAGAVEACRRELDSATASNTEFFLAPTHSNLAELLYQLGDRAGAARHQLTCLELARAHRQPVLVAFSMMLAARLLLSRGRHADAVRLQTVADRLLEMAGLDLYAEDAASRDELLGAARDHISVAFDRVVHEGRAFDPDDAADLAATVLFDECGTTRGDTHERQR